MIRETSGARTAEKQLEEALKQFGPCAGWVEGYRVVTVYDVDTAKGTARIGDAKTLRKASTSRKCVASAVDLAAVEQPL